MSVRINLELLMALLDQPQSLGAVSENRGFCMYWHSLGRDPKQAIEELTAPELGSKLAMLSERGADGKTVQDVLNRLSGVSLEQQVTRLLPIGHTIDIDVEFIPGGEVSVIAEGGTVAVNLFALKLSGNKLYIDDYPLLSLLANRIHWLATEGLNPKRFENEAGGVLDNFLTRMLREGCATLFFTVPISGPIYTLWQQALQQREADVERLRTYLNSKGFSTALPWELEYYFGLKGNKALAAKYPLGTWMCQVIEGAFGRSHLVDLLRHASDFVRTFEEARVKFGLPEKYSLADAG